MIPTLIDSAVIVEALDSTAKEDALREILSALVSAGRLSKRAVPAVARKIAEREAIGSTGIGNGIAVPHVKSEHAGSLTLALARSEAGIRYASIDGRAVHTVFMILAPVDQPEEHLQALRWISMLARNADFRRFVMSLGTADEIRDLLREMSQPA